MAPVTVKKEKAVALTNVPGGQMDESGYNFALVCGNRVEIFPPERFHEIQGEVERFLARGRTMEEVSITLLESEDPWK
jgi:hypothetical protein